jgi:tetratricopeptide (TPR) repeat protein
MAPVSSAQMTSKATVDTSETLFTLLSAANACGYDQELSASNPLRSKIRQEVAAASHSSDDAINATSALCHFYRDHQQQDPARDLAQYVSLALNLGPPPTFTPSLKEADFPPDATYVLGILPLLPAFYKSTRLHDIWERHHADYEALIERYHQPLSKTLLDTDLYLRMPFSGYMGRKFSILLEPLAAPGQANARNYAVDYYIVVSPAGDSLKLDQIRHTYLHYVLDPLAMNRATSMKRLAPLLAEVRLAPMDDSFKSDISLLVTESLIQAIEARLRGGPQAVRLEAVDSAMQQGFILTRYFYDALVKFEKGPTGLKDAYPDWLYYINLGQEKKRVQNIEFATRAAPDVVQASNSHAEQLLDRAEKQLNAGDLASAQQLAKQALNDPREDSGRAFFILAKTASLSKDMAGARNYFERTLEVSHEPRLLAWSHIYLGRIFDLQANREAAVQHYRAALQAGDPAPEAKAAAQRGMERPYAPPESHPQ